MNIFFFGKVRQSLRRWIGLGGVLLSVLVVSSCHTGISPLESAGEDLIDVSRIERTPEEGPGKARNAEQSEECPGTEEQPYAVVYPNGGEVFKIGDTIHMEFCTADPDSFPINPDRRPSISISVDNGIEYYELIEYLETPTAEYVIPDTLRKALFLGGEKKTSTISQTCRIKITDYFVQSITDVSDAAFNIVDSSSSVGISTGVIR